MLSAKGFLLFLHRKLKLILAAIFLLLLSVNVGEDCPVFDGLFEFCQLSTGGSIGKCMLLISMNTLQVIVFTCFISSFIFTCSGGS